MKKILNFYSGLGSTKTFDFTTARRVPPGQCFCYAIDDCILFPESKVRSGGCRVADRALEVVSPALLSR